MPSARHDHSRVGLSQGAVFVILTTNPRSSVTPPSRSLVGLLTVFFGASNPHRGCRLHGMTFPGWVCRGCAVFVILTTNPRSSVTLSAVEASLPQSPITRSSVTPPSRSLVGLLTVFFGASNPHRGCRLHGMTFPGWVCRKVLFLSSSPLTQEAASR